MKTVVYYLLLPLIYLVSILPFWWLYRISDFLFLVMYYVVGYRKKVVYTNLRNSFPEKSEAEIRVIQIKFFRYLCDLLVETIKGLTIRPSTLRKRLKFFGLEVFKNHYDKGQSVIIAMGHWGNWELGGARFAIEPLHKLYVIYHPIKDRNWNALIVKMRMRLGNGLYPMASAIRGMIQHKDETTATAFIADQTPMPNDAYWMTFLNQDTPVFTGMGKIANKMKYPVVYAGVRRVARGRYDIYLTDLVPNPGEMDPREIVEKFTRKLEEDIRSLPETWLWSHRRWKHKRKPPTNPEIDAEG